MFSASQWAARAVHLRASFLNAMFTRYTPPVYPWFAGTSPVNLGIDGPRTNMESQGMMLRTWPTAYRIPARGIGAMPVFQLGATVPVFNNSLAPFAPGRNVLMPGIAKKPFGG